MIRLELWVWRRKITEVNKVPFSSHHIKDTYTISMTYHCWYWPWLPGSGFSGFLHWKFIGVSPFLYCAHWEDVSVHSTHFSNGEICSTSFKMEYLHKLFGIFLHGRHLFHFLIYSLFLSNHYVLGYKPMCFFICFVFQTVTPQWLAFSVDTCVPSLHSYHCAFVFEFFLTFAPRDTSGLFYVLPVRVLELAIFLRAGSLFYPLFHL